MPTMDSPQREGDCVHALGCALIVAPTMDATNLFEPRRSQPKRIGALGVVITGSGFEARRGSSCEAIFRRCVILVSRSQQPLDVPPPSSVETPIGRQGGCESLGCAEAALLNGLQHARSLLLRRLRHADGSHVFDAVGCFGMACGFRHVGSVFASAFLTSSSICSPRNCVATIRASGPMMNMAGMYETP